MPGRPRRTAIPLALAFLAALLLPAGSAAARPAGVAHTKPPARVEIERVGLTAPVAGRSQLLVAVRYPIQLAGQPLELSAKLEWPGGAQSYTWNVGARANAGALRLPDRRRTFAFVHAIPLTREQTRQARRHAAVVVDASGALDLNGDGIAELDSRDHERHRVRSPSAGRRLCGSVPQLRTRPGKRAFAPLPRCGSAVRWRIAGHPRGGDAHIYKGRLVYRSGNRFRGTATIELAAVPRRAKNVDSRRPYRGPESPGSAATGPLSAPVQIQVLSERGEGAVVRAMGDSVTAGFGYYSDGSSMPFSELLNCRPGEGEYDDACSSNSTVRTNKKGTKLEYAADYGLSNGVSWAAQWANQHSVKNYANFAVSGSEPKDWAPGGQLYATTKRIESESPDYVLMTVGANPLLSDVLFGADNMGCAVWAEIVGGFSECVERAFAEVELRANLAKLYRELVGKTSAVIYLMQYPLTVPSTALAYSSTQIAEMGALLNREIAAAAAEVSKARLRPVAPPHFNVGIDVSPAYPSTYTCSYFEYKVDGPSVQSEPSQDELEVDHPLSFCKGPSGGGEPWVISGDTGIHPSASGYARMAAEVPAP